MTTAPTGLQKPGHVRIKNVSYDEAVARLVRTELTKLDATQTELAQAMSMTQVAISRRLKAHVSFSVTELAAIAQLLGVDVSDLMPKKHDDVVLEVRRRNETRASVNKKVTRLRLPRLDSNQQPSG